MIPYVEHGALTNAPGPLRCEDTTLYAFWARGSRDKIEALCRRLFDDHTDGAVKVKPLLSWVVLTIGVTERIRVETPPFDRMGHVRERIGAIWVPVRCEGPEGTPKVAAFIPYIWLDDPMSIASGREVYGYPKSYGWPRFPGAMRGPLTRPPRLTLDAYGIERFGRDERAGRHRLFTLTGLGTPPDDDPVASVTAAEEDDSHPLAEMVRAFARLLPPSEREGLRGLEGDAVSALAGGGGVQQLFLRQFRHPERAGEASQSQVVVGPARVEGKGRTRLMRPYRLSVRELATHPLAEELGLRPKSWCPAMRIQMTFTVDPGRVLWDAADA